MWWYKWRRKHAFIVEEVARALLYYVQKEKGEHLKPR
jgi:hypothetical protein